ncbi:hypothetical protein ILUMI_11537 [Ignelater luminosus]|uniref:Large ribosomal subunit protein mL49 n=1 Tax=Ignelater luminosus TaxID=2038154 RepID=A0A8K0CW18_IGNLU|nr:hypothetical protein ILUMI_11537 [Ignelater luminosus]
MASINTKIYSLCNRLNLRKSTALFSQFRHSSYYSSPFVVDVGDVNVKYEVSKNPEEWKYVERALPPLLIPTPTKKPKYNSEWKPQGDDFKNLPYYISRTKNHMTPVYLKVVHGTKRITIIKKIQGDIWLLEKELREFLKPQQLAPIRSQVNEFAGFIRFHGDYVNAIKYWLTQRNL